MPLPKGNKKTDKQRERQKNYDAAHFKVAACKIPVADYLKFQAYADARGKTVAGMLASYINGCIAGSGSAPE